MDPINYAIDVQSPFQAALQGYQAGAAIRNDQQQQQALQLAQQQQQQLQSDVGSVLRNPNASAADFAALTLKYPQLKDQFKQANDMLSSEQKRNFLDHGTQVYAALSNGRPDIAKQLLDTRAEAMRNAGDAQGAAGTEMISKMIDQGGPALAKNVIALKLSGLDDKFAENVSKLGGEQRAQEQAPADLAKKQADAAKAGVDAKYAEPQALKDLEVKGWNIENIKSEIGFRKESNRIAAMNAAISRETNAIRRQELQLQVDAARQKLDQSARDKVADVQAASSTIDNLLNTVDRIKQNPSLDSVLGSLEGRDFYPNALAGALNPMGNGDERNDAIALIDTLGSQAFLSQIPAMKGTGSLSEREGDKLQASLQNLSRKQSEGQFRQNLDEVQRLMLKARKNVETRYGVKAGVPDTPAVKTTPEGIDALVSKYLNPAPPGAR